MVLDEALPETIRQHFDQMIAELLDPEGLTLKDIDSISTPAAKKFSTTLASCWRPTANRWTPPNRYCAIVVLIQCHGPVYPQAVYGPTRKGR
ncbi:MAG: hypothetical protein R2857_03100 [Vampirovibrionales bacterium]